MLINRRSEGARSSPPTPYCDIPSRDHYQLDTERPISAPAPVLKQGRNSLVICCCRIPYLQVSHFRSLDSPRLRRSSAEPEVCVPFLSRAAPPMLRCLCLRWNRKRR